jgi:hypothetical protein
VLTASIIRAISKPRAEYCVEISEHFGQGKSLAGTMVEEVRWIVVKTDRAGELMEISFYHTTQRYIPEDSHNHLNGNMTYKSSSPKSLIRIQQRIRMV